MKRPIRERDVERHLVRHVQQIGGEVRKVTWPGRSGAPDRVVFFPGGVVVWVELKRPTGRAEPHQHREHERMRAMGQTVLVLRSEEDILREFPE